MAHTLWSPDFDNTPRPSSPVSSCGSSFDDDEVNCRVTPSWLEYRDLLNRRGFRLDTIKDVRHFYEQTSEDRIRELGWSSHVSRCFEGRDDDALCPDPGLPDNLYRGTQICTGRKIVVKAVHLKSREFDVIRFLSTPPIRDHPMNHCIPVLDLIEAPPDDLAFIVMEEWSSQLIDEQNPCCLRLFLSALRQCIEHGVFMHKHHIAHLDISIRNLLTDFNGHYAYIDFELSRRFEGLPTERVYSDGRGTEIPPECEDGNIHDPYKVDVWALAVLMLRACKLTGFHPPELLEIIKPMLNEDPADRPPLHSVLYEFDKMVSSMVELLHETPCSTLD